MSPLNQGACAPREAVRWTTPSRSRDDRRTFEIAATASCWTMASLVIHTNHPEARRIKPVSTQTSLLIGRRALVED